jgi:hypothetical protein
MRYCIYTLVAIVTFMDIKELKPQEMEEIIDFYYHIEDYGHIFHLEPEKLDEPFKKIIEGISEIRQMIDDSYGM